MPPKKRATSKDRLTKTGRGFAEEIFEQFERQKQNPAGTFADNRIPVTTDALVAKLYGGEDPFTPANFSVPGVDSPSAKLMMWVDKERPFTRRFQCIDPQTGRELASKLGVQPEQCASEWLQLYKSAFDGLARQAEKIKTEKGAKDAVTFLSANMPEFAKIYRNMMLLAKNPHLSASNKATAQRTLNKIDTYLTFQADLQLAQSIQTSQKSAFTESLALLSNPNSGLTAKEQAVLASTLLKIAGPSPTDPDLVAARAQIIQLQSDNADKAKKEIEAAVALLSPYIEAYWPSTVGAGVMNYEKMVLMRDFILRQLASPKNTYKVDLPMSKFDKPQEKAEISKLVADLVTLKNADPAVDLKEVAKRIREKYADAKPSLGLTNGVFNTMQDRGIIGRFPEFSKANLAFDRLTKEYLKPACSEVAPTKVKQFMSLYVVYHELMILYMIFYYTGCSSEYKDSDITSLADDWLRWLRGNPFHVTIKKSARNMNIDEFNRINPQSFFGLLLDPPSGNFGDFGFQPGSLTFGNYKTDFATLVSIAGEITKACAGKTGLDQYSEDLKFLATVVENFVPIFDSVSKSNAIRWVKGPDGRIVREVSGTAITKCEETLANVGLQLNPGGAPIQPAAAAAAVTPAAAVAPPPPPANIALPGPTVPVVFQLFRPIDRVILEASVSDAANRWTKGADASTTTATNPAVLLDDSIAAASGRYNWQDANQGLFLFNTDGSPLDARVNDAYAATPIDDLGDYFTNVINAADSKYIQPISAAFTTNDLNAAGQLRFLVSSFPDAASVTAAAADANLIAAAAKLGLTL